LCGLLLTEGNDVLASKWVVNEHICGSLKNANGPYDYTDPEARRVKLPIVELVHFNEEIRNLKRGKHAHSSSVENDLQYTLRVFPNHHQALYTYGRYRLTDPAKNARESIDCYFERAFRFKPDDVVAHMVYGIVLMQHKRYQEALEPLLKAIELDPQLSEAHYNLGLLYLELNKPDLALKHAKISYELGYPLPGLKAKLVAIGLWNN